LPDIDRKHMTVRKPACY